MDFDELNDVLAESNRHARHGRAIARLILVLTAGLIVFLLALAFVVAPSPCMCPMFATPPEAFGLPLGVILVTVGFVGLAAGLFWMWRIVRADPEPDARSWRHLQRP
ncbi:MAG: hypothetical protein M3Q66_11815 [Chloroflexota bacterium]|nr:hypothetical protein [Chloroflexota bacterium]